MFGFNVNQPIEDPRIIAAVMGSYATPEAARSDFEANAPEGMNYLTKQYQRLTGDWFADPFSDAEKQATNARILTASLNRPVSRVNTYDPTKGAVGFDKSSDSLPASMTMTLGQARDYQRPTPVAPLQLPSFFGPTPTAAVSPLLPTPPPSNAPAAMNTLIPASVADARLSTVGTARFPSKMVIPPVDDRPLSPVGQLGTGYLDTLKRRANEEGVGQQFDAILANDPHAFTPTGEDLTNDPLFSKLQGPNGKALAGDIHSVVFNPKFREYLATRPDVADKIYRAATGQDFATARAAKIQQYVEERAQQEKILEGFKGLAADPVTGEVHHTIEKQDQFGNTVTRTEVPLDPLYVNMLKARGGRVAGVQIPGIGGIRESMPGQGEEFYNKFVNTYKDIRTKNPNLSSAQAQQMTIAAMKSSLPSNSATTAASDSLGFGEVMAQVNPSELITDMLTAAPRMGANLAKGVLNLVPRTINAEAAAFGNKTRIPLIPDIPAIPDFTDFNTGPNTVARAEAARLLASRLIPAVKGFTGETVPPADLGPITPDMRKRALAAKAKRLSPDVLRMLLPRYFDQSAMAGQ